VSGSPDEDEEVEVGARRPRVITVAFWLLITSAVLWILVGGSGDPSGRQGIAAALCFYVWAAARIRRGGWTARIVGTAAAVWLLVVLGPEYPHGRAYAVLDIMAVVVTGTGVALLHGRRGNAYFRRRPW